MWLGAVIMIAFSIIYALSIQSLLAREYTKSVEELGKEFEDEKNSMIAVTEADKHEHLDFYDEFDNSIVMENSMNIIFFGPTSSFLRLDTETLLHILTNTEKHLIPIARALLAWDIITDGKTAAFLQGRELLAFGSLLEVVPEEDLYYVNFGDPSVFKYFSRYKVNLSNRKFGILVAAYKRYFGNYWYLNGSHINELGYLLCGFPSFELKQISPKIFRDLNVDVLGKLDRCSINQTKTLYDIAIHNKAYGHPYEWSSHAVGRLNVLFTCISNEDISSIPLEAISAITPSVMKLLSLTKLQYFTKEQILRMNQSTRRIYILRVLLMNSLDTSQLAKKSAHQKEATCIIVFLIYIITKTMLYQNH